MGWGLVSRFSSSAFTEISTGTVLQNYHPPFKHRNQRAVPKHRAWHRRRGMAILEALVSIGAQAVNRLRHEEVLEGLVYFMSWFWSWDQGKHPDVIRESLMLPDIVLHSRLTKQVVLLKLIVPWESRLEQQYVFNLLKNEKLVARLRRDGHPTRLLVLEVDARRLVSTSAYGGLQQLGLRGQSKSRARKRLGEAA